MFRCPVEVCRQPLAEADDGRTWRCPSGHVHDVAREGYVNLLITHQRRQREPGDSAEMLRHRRAFLDAGHYRVLADAVRDVAGLAPGMAVLDAGCGEGHYTRDWPATSPVRLWGVDIAKPAVRMAAKRAAPGARYAVASVYDLPVVDASIDLAVSVFAPLHSPEFERVVRAGGRVLTVTPGPDHLAGLKAKLFAEPEVHPETGPFERDGATTRLEPEPGRSRRVTADLHLDDAAAVDHLLHMTPYAWYVAPEVRAAVVSEGSLSTPIDFVISTYRRP